MGLDMYIFAQRSSYVTEYGGSQHAYCHRSNRIKLDYPKTLTSFFDEYDRKNDTPNRDRTCKRLYQYEIGYFRKANAIHGWIVDHLAGGVDDCNDIVMSVEDMELFLSSARKVVADHSLASKIMPTKDGFFFGPLTYDEDYFEDLERAVSIFERAVKFLKDREAHKDYDWTIAYHASW